MTRPVDSIDAQTVADLVAELHAADSRANDPQDRLGAGDGPRPRAASSRTPPRPADREDAPRGAPAGRAADRRPRRGRRPAAADPLPAAALVLDATGMRVGELEALTWGDLDEPRGRWRVSRASKTGRPRWVTAAAAAASRPCSSLCARDDRHPERRVFQGFGGDRFRTALTRACTAAAVPAFSPHDLRHRRVSLLHLAGVPWARIGEQVGHDDLVTTARTYTHVVADERELDYGGML